VLRLPTTLRLGAAQAPLPVRHLFSLRMPMLFSLLTMSSCCCSYCGHVFCELCTPQRSLIREDQILTNPERKYLAVNAHNPQRVCDDCHARLEPQQEELRTSLPNSC
jgi:hypothetical protein